MPLTSLQVEALKILAQARDAESYVAGSTPLNLSSDRYSSDIDIFHDRAERVALQAESDARLLVDAGFSLTWQRQTASIHSAVVAKGGDATKLDWAADSDFRFFPTVRDQLFGYRLHPADLAINKVFAAAGRSEPRDIYDLAVIDEAVAPLSALIWAGVEKSPGFTPEGLIDEIRRNLVHPLSAWEEIAASAPVNPRAVTERVRSALDHAEGFAQRMPSAKLGLLFVNAAGAVVEPDPERLDDCAAHTAQRHGHWPTSPEITQALFDQLYKDR